MHRLSGFFRSRQNNVATNVADTMNDTYLKTSGDKGGIASYGQVCDLLVSWHIQTVVLPSIAVEESLFDPYDETQVDLSGIVTAQNFDMPAGYVYDVEGEQILVRVGDKFTSIDEIRQMKLFELGLNFLFQADIEILFLFIGEIPVVCPIAF